MLFLQSSQKKGVLEVVLQLVKITGEMCRNTKGVVYLNSRSFKVSVNVSATDCSTVVFSTEVHIVIPSQNP